MRDCTFRGNIAVAAGAIAAASKSNGNYQDFSSAHALGSGMFVRYISHGAVLKHISFSRNSVQCSATNCLAAGTVFISQVQSSASFTSMMFVDCQVGAVGPSSELKSGDAKLQSVAIGACIAVAEASVGLLQISNIESIRCGVQSLGRVVGGCLSVLQKLYNAAITNVSIAEFKSSSVDSAHGVVMAFGEIQNVNLSGLSFMSISASSGFQLNSLLFTGSIASAAMTSIASSNIHFRGESSVFLLFSASRSLQNVVVSGISLQHSTLHASTGQSSASLVRVSLLLAEVTLHSIVALNVSQSCGGASASRCTAGGLVHVTHAAAAGNFVIRGVEVRDVSTVCDGTKCSVVALLHAVESDATLQWSGASFVNINATCRGLHCKVLGGCMSASYRGGSIRDIAAFNVALRAFGEQSFAAAAVLHFGFSGPSVAFSVANVSALQISIKSVGTFSIATGGAIFASYGNVFFSNISVLNSIVSCSGAKCQSTGGALALTSSNSANPQYPSMFFVQITNSLFHGSAVSCSGKTCVASGGAIIANAAFRGRLLRSIDSSAISPLRASIIALSVSMSFCALSENRVSADSTEAVLSGAGISIVNATARISSSNITKNVLQSLLSSSFISGAGVYVQGSSATVRLDSTVVEFNHAGDRGTGGAIFVGDGAFVSCTFVSIGFNKAQFGGGINVDGKTLLVSNSNVFNNSATQSGGGVLCAATSNTYSDSATSIVFSNVSFYDNFIAGDASAYGAAALISGNVRVTPSLL
jgi:hypothetical protein